MIDMVASANSKVIISLPFGSFGCNNSLTNMCKWIIVVKYYPFLSLQFSLLLLRDLTWMNHRHKILSILEFTIFLITFDRFDSSYFYKAIDPWWIWPVLNLSQDLVCWYICYVLPQYQLTLLSQDSCTGWIITRIWIWVMILIWGTRIQETWTWAPDTG